MISRWALAVALEAPQLLSCFTCVWGCECHQWHCARFFHPFSCSVWWTFLHGKTTVISIEPLLYLENVEDMMKSDSCSDMVVRWDWMAKKHAQRKFFTHFHVLCGGLFLLWKTTAISKSPYYILKYARYDEKARTSSMTLWFPKNMLCEKKKFWQMF